MKRGGVGGVWVQGEQGEGVKKERAKRYSGPNRVYKGGGVNLLGCPGTTPGWRLVIEMYVEKQAFGRRKSVGVI